MVRKAKNIFDLPISECFELYDSNGPYMYIGFEILKNQCAGHSKVLKWSHNVAKKIKKDWEVIMLEFLKPNGIKKVIATFPEDDTKWPKFINLLGFPKPRKVMVSIMEI